MGGLINQIAERALAVHDGSGNSRLDNAMALKAGYDTYKLFNPGDAASAAAQSGPDALKNAGSSANFGIAISIGSSKSESNSQSASSQALGTNVQAKEITLTARETDIHLQAAKLQAENITLDDARDVLLEAAANTSSLQSDNKSSSASVGVTFGQQMGISFQLGIRNTKDKANGSKTVSPPHYFAPRKHLSTTWNRLDRRLVKPPKETTGGNSARLLPRLASLTSLSLSWYKPTTSKTAPRSLPDAFRLLHHHGRAVFFRAGRQCLAHCRHRGPAGHACAE